jgi:hypothetical protein
MCSSASAVNNLSEVSVSSQARAGIDTKPDVADKF